MTEENTLYIFQYIYLQIHFINQDNNNNNKKSETELTASVLKKDPKHTRD